jgi:mRNA interferase MazF
MIRGDVFWADLGDPIGSEPGNRRPVLIVQADEFNGSRLATVIVLGITTNLNLKNVPGCVFLSSTETGLPKDSICNVTQIRTIDRRRIDDHVGQLDDSVMFIVDNALRRVLGI